MIPVVLAAALLAADGPAPPRPSPRPSPSVRPSPASSPAPKASANPGAAASPRPGASPRTYTNKDLPEREAGEESPEPPPTPDPSLVDESPREAVDETGTSGGASRGTEEDWRARAQAARNAITEVDAEVVRLEARIAELRSDVNPTTYAGDPNREQRIQDEIRRLREELEAARRRAVEARQALADLEEEARRKGVPPGWLRPVS